LFDASGIGKLANLAIIEGCSLREDASVVMLSVVTQESD
jgi:hypothetical protein